MAAVPDFVQVSGNSGIAWGAATILAGENVVEVIHGLGTPPTNIQVTPREDPGGAVWVENVDGSNLEICGNCQSEDIAYNWIAFFGNPFRVDM